MRYKSTKKTDGINRNQGLNNRFKFPQIRNYIKCKATKCS